MNEEARGFCVLLCAVLSRLDAKLVLEEEKAAWTSEKLISDPQHGTQQSNAFIIKTLNRNFEQKIRAKRRRPTRQFSESIKFN